MEESRKWLEELWGIKKGQEGRKENKKKRIKENTRKQIGRKEGRMEIEKFDSLITSSLWTSFGNVPKGMKSHLDKTIQINISANIIEKKREMEGKKNMWDEKLKRETEGETAKESKEKKKVQRPTLANRLKWNFN